MNTKKVSEAAKFLTSHKDKICRQHIKEALFMCKVASEVKLGTIVEIGRCRGGGMVLMSMASPSSVIYSMEPRTEWDNLALKYAKKFEVPTSRFEMMTGCSWDFIKDWTRPIDLLFVDGEHNEKYVYQDLTDWVPLVKSEGLVLMHDYFDKGEDKGKLWKQGARNALKRFQTESGRALEYVDHARSMRLFKKK